MLYKMKKNVGTIDRILRGLVAAAILLLYLTHQISGGTASVLGIIALVMFLTSTLGFCPCYVRLNVNTSKKKNDEKD
jgi:predicted membrane channel-forming protein YqfA (hemolysin III family)